MKLTKKEVNLILDALDSHVYWQLSDERHRHSGEVFDVERPDECVISDDPEKQAQGVACRKLIEKLDPAPSPPRFSKGKFFVHVGEAGWPDSKEVAGPFDTYEEAEREAAKHRTARQWASVHQKE